MIFFWQPKICFRLFFMWNCVSFQRDVTPLLRGADSKKENSTPSRLELQFHPLNTMSTLKDMLNILLFCSPAIYSAAKSADARIHFVIGGVDLCAAAGWCSAGRLWCDCSTADASATATTRRMTWCWECASMPSNSPSHTAPSSTRWSSRSYDTSFVSLRALSVCICTSGVVNAWAIW